MVKFDYNGLTGDLVTKERESYEQDRKQWNRAIERYPIIIVYCYNEEDVANAIKWARLNELPIRIRSGGHHYEGFSTGNDVVVIDVSRMNGIHIDEEKKIVKIQGGVRNRELYEATGKAGYPFPGGGCPTVGVVGFTLGGGWGYSSRILGLGCDNLVEAEIINYQGKMLVVNENENEDLFWAIRGSGGGNFGIVTSLTFKLPEKIQNAVLINIDCPNRTVEESAAIFQIYQHMFKTLDHRANLKMAVYNSKEKGKGVKFTGIFYGSKDEANKVVMPIKEIPGELHITMEDMSVLEVNQAIQDSHPDYESYKSAGRFVYKNYSKEEIMRLISLVDKRAEGSVYTALSLYGLGGKVLQCEKKSTSFYYRDAAFIMGLQSVWEEPCYAQVNREWTVERLNYIKTMTTGSFVNFPLAELDNYEEAYYGENAKMLKKIREKYDPFRVFEFEQGL